MVTNFKQMKHYDSIVNINGRDYNVGVPFGNKKTNYSRTKIQQKNQFGYLSGLIIE